MSRHPYIEATAYRMQRLIVESGQKAQILHALIEAGDKGVTAEEIGLTPNQMRPRINELCRTYEIVIHGFPEASAEKIPGRIPHRYFLKTLTTEQVWRS